nr:SUMF1/EgtB/PvdO family nonheme iron enzyme [Deltaproteobacteria bacterium]
MRGALVPIGRDAVWIVRHGGSVWEWTLDWFGPYQGNASTYAPDPVGPSSGDRRVLRGGAWYVEAPILVRAAFRDPVPPTQSDPSSGFVAPVPRPCAPLASATATALHPMDVRSTRRQVRPPVACAVTHARPARPARLGAA